MTQTRIFGINIAKILGDAVRHAGGLLEGTLVRTTPGQLDPDDPTASTQDITSTHSFQGVIETEALRRSGSTVVENQSVLTIIAATISPETVPAANDHIRIGGRRYELVQLLQEDPAEATYRFSLR